MTRMFAATGTSLAVLLGLMGCLELDPASDVTAREQTIVGGTPTVAGEFGGVAVLVIAPTEICTATLIHEEWVVTAAHCLNGKQVSDVQVLFDKLDLKATGGISIAAASIVRHPQFDNAHLGDNDIALIKLATPQPKRTRYPVYRTVPTVGGEFTQVGYGASAAPNLGSGIQRKLVTKSAACGTFGAGNLDPTKVMCFGANDGNGTCFGDSGGPTFIKNGDVMSVTGVTSFGADDQCTGYDAITLVPAEIAFLDQYVPQFTPVNTSGDGPPIQDELAGGCAATPGTSAPWLCLLVLVPLCAAARRRARRT